MTYTESTHVLLNLNMFSNIQYFYIYKYIYTYIITLLIEEIQKK